MIGGGMSHRGFMGRNKGGGVLPPSNTDLIHWLDSDDESTIVYSSGSNVSEWRDKSVSGNHCTVMNTSFYPVKITEGISFPPGSFVCAPLNFNPDVRPNGFQIMIALQRTGVNELNNVGSFLGRHSSSIYFAYHATNGFMGASNAMGIYEGSYETSPLNSFDTSKCIVTISGSGESGTKFSEMEMYRNNVSQNITADNKIFTYNEIGGRQVKSSASPNLYNISWIGTYFELLTWNKKLDTIENSEALSYLSSKWGITL